MTFIARPIAAETVAAARRRFAEGDASVLRRIVDASLGYPCRCCLRDGYIPGLSTRQNGRKD
ncbi:MAG: hypothetical protein SGJ23_06030 [Alphaproteobacteria bacterium]|nr:hypothetical protein [Alphaproteobacteria bacterium]